MLDDKRAKLEEESHRLAGAVDVLDELREELEQWLEEAQDESKRESLENLLGHVGAMEEEYIRRRDQAITELKE